jgi:hypothetical protein
MKKTFALITLLFLVTLPLFPTKAACPANIGSCQVCSCVICPANSEYRYDLSIKDKNLWQKLKGRIVLRVQGKGELYYVDPGQPVLHYLGNPVSALKTLQLYGIGVSNNDLKKIPVQIIKLYGKDSDLDGLTDQFEKAIGTNPNNFNTDGDRYSDRVEILNSFNPNGAGNLPISQRLVNRLKGRILLQVQSAGESWYVNPADGKRYYISNKYDVADLIKKTAVGISDATFNRMVQ